MQMSDSEIRRRHKEGATVQILADLNAVPSSNIKAILENKPIPATPTRKYQHRNEEYKKLYDEGKGDSEIGELMGTRASNVWSWRKTNKLPSNVAPKRKKVKEVEPISISMDVEDVVEDIPNPDYVAPKQIRLPYETPTISQIIKPHDEWIMDRKLEILSAMKRMAEFEKDIPYQWVTEYLKLIDMI